MMTPPSTDLSPELAATSSLKLRRKALRNRKLLNWLGILTLITLLCTLVPLLSPYHYSEQDLALGAAAPCWEHPFGTDLLGRDVFVRVCSGGRLSLAVGFAGAAVAVLIGVAYGSLAGALGGRIDSAMMRLLDILYALPFTLFVILLMSLFGRNMILLFLAIGAIEWLSMARVVRGQILALKTRPFVEAATAMGQSKKNIIIKHFLPNMIGSIIAWGTLCIPHIMALEALVSFIGLGAQPPATSWGLLIGEGAKTMALYPWLLIFPALLFSLTLLSINAIGDSLRDTLDPRM